MVGVAAKLGQFYYNQRMAISGIQAFLELLAGFGVRHIFGNPGTTEMPLNDALVGDRRFQYVLGLQEVPVMAMADGYAMASGQLGVVNLHISCGLGNAMGMLYNAYREGTPLLVTAGQQDRRLMFEEPILWGQMVEVTRPWTKWACEVQSVQDLPSAVRRAAQIALTPPTGPVFLSLPIDVQMAERHPLRILLAEDNLVNQKLALRLLTQMGYRADVAANGLEAIQSIERQPYDVVLMDVQMPEMDGLEATREIVRRWPGGARPRIVAMTANAMAGDREECIAAGMDDYITKPIRVDALVGALEQTTQRRDT